MAYLHKIVGLTGTTIEPLPGVRLVNSLPIISEDFVTGIGRMSDESPIDDVWGRIIENAEAMIEQDLFLELMKDEKFRQTQARTYDFGIGSGSRTASARWEGARIKAQRNEFSHLKINSIYVSGSGSFVVKCFNLTTGTEVFVLDAVTVTGEGYIDVNKSILLDKLTNDYLISVDCTSIDLVAIDGNRGIFFDGCKTDNYVDVEISSGYIFDAQTKVSSNFVASTCFVHVVAEVQSNMTTFIEKNVDLFSMAAWYLCGGMLLNESFNSDSFNRWTNTNAMQRMNQAAIFGHIYKSYLEKLVQPVMMRIAPSNIVIEKHASEKEGGGFYVQDALQGAYQNLHEYDML